MKKIDAIFDPVLDYHRSIYSDRELQPRIEQLGALQALISLGTVRLGVGRQTGNTSYMARTAQSVDLIITKDLISKEHTQRLTDVFNLGGCKRVFTYVDIAKLHRDKDVLFSDSGYVRDVWIDDASLQKPETLDELYRMFAGTCGRFILIN
jgi:hypothetical protein